jgi:hypothetical protein
MGSLPGLGSEVLDLIDEGCDWFRYFYKPPASTAASLTLTSLYLLLEVFFLCFKIG